MHAWASSAEEAGNEKLSIHQRPTNFLSLEYFLNWPLTTNESIKYFHLGEFLWKERDSK